MKHLEKFLDALENTFKFPDIKGGMNWTRNLIIKWGIDVQIALKRKMSGGVPPVPVPSVPRDFRLAKCWCGHYAQSHSKESATYRGCQVYDCPCEKLMDPTIVVCVKCLQLHPSEDPCQLPDTPRVVGGVSQGVLVNFKPAKEKHET